MLIPYCDNEYIKIIKRRFFNFKPWFLNKTSNKYNDRKKVIRNLNIFEERLYTNICYRKLGNKYNVSTARIRQIVNRLKREFVYWERRNPYKLLRNKKSSVEIMKDNMKKIMVGNNV